MGCCTICGSHETLSGGLCKFTCYWLLEGWVAWDARHARIRFFDQRGLQLWADYPMTYPATIERARTMGWTGHQNVHTTFVQAKAMRAGA